MKQHPRWIAAFVALFLSLGVVMQAAKTQTVGQAMVSGTFYQSNGPDTLVLRLRPAPGSHLVSVNGGGTGIVPPQPDGLLGLLTGVYDSATQEIRLTVQLPLGNQSSPLAIVGMGRGTYNPATASFSVTFTDNQGKSPKTYNNVALDTGAIPYVVGVWYWTAAANPGLLFTNPTYGGQFHITSQEPSGRIRGTFGRTNPGDIGTIDGTVTVDQINFTRSGTIANGVPFLQIWGGTLTEERFAMLGAIEQNMPVPWSGDFEARASVYRNP